MLIAVHGRLNGSCSLLESTGHFRCRWFDSCWWYAGGQFCRFNGGLSWFGCSGGLLDGRSKSCRGLGGCRPAF